MCSTVTVMLFNATFNKDILKKIEISLNGPGYRNRTPEKCE
jgi:hypothetical protein